MSDGATLTIASTNLEQTHTDHCKMSEPIPSLTSRSSSTPWGKPSPVSSCSLNDVMSEQMATHLQDEENNIESKLILGSDSPNPEADLHAFLEIQSGDTADDAMIARYMQMQFDAEHDDMLNAEEQKYNGSSKISVSFDKYKMSHPKYIEEESDDEEEYAEESPWKSPEDKIGKTGIRGKGKNIKTKHDAEICGRRNAERMMEFPPEFEVGDGEIMDLKIPNHVYNKLKEHSIHENKRHHRLHDKKEMSTAEKAMDPRTRLLLYKLVNAGVLECVNGAISTGKESVVFHAMGGSLSDESLPEECAIKVFKTTLNEFKNRQQYVHGDHRFAKDDFKKQNPRKIIKIWAEKETSNLNRMKKFKVPCPRVVILKKHILVMEFIGHDQRPAPKLCEADLCHADAEVAYEQVVAIMKRLHKECHLVHADLSEYNLLWHNNQVIVIDVSQAVDITHPKAMEFLYRDCHNIQKFFRKKGVHKVPTAEQLFNKITGLKIMGEDGEFVAQVQRYDKNKNEEMLANQMSYKEYAFDYYFDKSLKDKQDVLSKMGISDESDDDSGE